MKRVCILYGLAEGKLNSKLLRKELLQAGFTVVESALEADVVLCHSGGIFMLPSDGSAANIIAIGVPHNPNSHLISNVFKKLTREVKDPSPAGLRAKKLLINCIYIFNIPRHAQMLKGYKTQLYNPIDKAKVTIVANQQDPFIDCRACLNLPTAKNWGFLGMTGQHDDLWVTPKPYVEMVSSLLSSR